MAFLSPPGFSLLRALRIVVILHTLAAVPALGKVLLIVEDSASIYEHAARGFLLGFGSADAVETITLSAEGTLRDRKSLGNQASAAQLVIAIGTKAAVAARSNFPSVPLLYCLALDPARHALVGTNIG